MTLQDIVDEVNARTSGRPIGTLQRFRGTNLGLQRVRSKLFGKLRDTDYAFHSGGREGLQFNIGWEEGLTGGDMRFGVAFSLELSQTLPAIAPLVPKIARFNDYLRQNPEEFAGLQMWHYAGDRSPVREPGPILADLVRRDVFVFLGSLGDSSAPDYDTLLTTFDRLMPLYRFVEAAAVAESAALSAEAPLRLGCSAKAFSTTASLTERVLNIELRHNALQFQLHSELVDEFGYDHVATEQPATGGGKIDVLVADATTRIVYEIKTATNARGCIREAMGQLLDYSCWPGGPKVDKIVIAGAPALTPEAEAYLARLNLSFPIPLEYRAIALS